MYLRADEAEKVRKELEHHVNFCEEKVEKMENELMNAKKTMRETHDKYDETSKIPQDFHESLLDTSRSVID